MFTLIIAWVKFEKKYEVTLLFNLLSYRNVYLSYGILEAKEMHVPFTIPSLDLLSLWSVAMNFPDSPCSLLSQLFLSLCTLSSHCKCLNSISLYLFAHKQTDLKTCLITCFCISAHHVLAIKFREEVNYVRTEVNLLLHGTNNEGIEVL